jgi:hypothetical protein
MLDRLSKWLFVASFAMAFAPSLFGVESANLDFAVLGAIGLFGGMLTNVVEKTFAMRGIWRIGGSLLASLMLMKYLSANLATYALGTMVILKLLYDLSKAVGPGSRLARVSILLGQYSLVCTLLRPSSCRRCPGGSRDHDGSCDTRRFSSYSQQSFFCWYSALA